VPITTTQTVTVPTTTTVTTAVPTTKTITVPTTTTVTTSVPTTVVVPTTVTEITTETVPTTITNTTTVPVTNTVTNTVTHTVTSGTTETETVTTTVYPYRGDNGPNVRARGDMTTSTTSTSTTTGDSACGTPGTTTSLGNGEVETCGPNYGHVAVFATTPGLYNKIFDNSSYYVSAGIFAPQFRYGHLAGCYYVPDKSSVTAPGATMNTDGTLTDAVAFGLHSYDVSYPRWVPSDDCGS
jgi:hypothetical protein